MSRVPAALWKNFIAVQIYGANTGVGKTVFSTLLGSHFAKRRSGKTNWKVQYIKPVSTGPASDADDSYVHRYTGQSVSTLFQFKEPVSPHIAARDAPYIPSDEHLNHQLYSRLQDEANLYSTSHSDRGFAIVETAGGVLSPGPSGTPQADIFRPMRLPAVLVGDHRLGGIASTISAAESLVMRGYNIDAVVCFDDKSKYQNGEYLKKYFEKMGIPAFELSWIPSGIEKCGEKEERERMAEYYQTASRSDQAHKIAGEIIDRHTKRLDKMDSMASRTNDIIWHPFTQHKHVEKADDLLVFDSAYGDYFQVKRTSKSQQDAGPADKTSLLYPAFDGSASWWTQGLGHGNPRLALEAAHAAGRYGHIMFAGATHEPALTLAERLINGLENPRLKKVFYTDDGSTATEVGIKMGLRAACVHYGWNGSKENIGVLGLKGSYHGDTIGAMDASEPCIFNEKVDWYRGRGYWFDFPTFKMRKGRWIVEPPAGMGGEFGATQHFENLEDIFNFESRGRSQHYESYIEKMLDELVKKQRMKFGALVMEPVILGAGGMIFVDPLFQQSLVRVVRRYDFSSSAKGATPADADEHTWTGLPVVFDEVFTGLYRLGRFSSASYLGVHPDISVHAKLLTGGLLPLSITAASESIFRAFWGDNKSDALLHGHSYTAHPVGCHVANVSLETIHNLQSSPTWQGFKEDWNVAGVFKQDEGAADGRQSISAKPVQPNAEVMWSMWSRDFVLALSNHKRVDCVNALGSVLAVTLVDTSGSGYSSSAAVGLRDALLHNISSTKIQIHSRILGNVIYFMASMTSNPEHLSSVEAAFMEKLEAADQ